MEEVQMEADDDEDEVRWLKMKMEEVWVRIVKFKMQRLVVLLRRDEDELFFHDQCNQ